MTYPEMKAAALEIGFSCVAPLDPGTIQLKEEVRRMCQADGCGQYGKRWSCPPGCGSLEDCAREIRRYSGGILVQTLGELEDEWDGEGMMEAEARHKANFLRLYRVLRRQHPEVLAIGTGCCTRCAACTYPDAPCRFPEEMVSSMEAYGMVVLEVCKANHLPYYYGPCRIAYTGCFLLNP